MAKTVDNFATIEDFRKQYNELAYDVGEVTGLNDALKLGSNDTIVDAINVLDNKQFFLQEFIYVATTNQVTFQGADAQTNSLIYKKDHIQVFKNERHLVEDVDYIVAASDGAGAYQAVILQGTYASGQANAMAANDRLTIYSYTGAFIGTEISGSASTFFQKSAENTIYNTNASGIILNGDNSSATTILESGYTVQLAGRTFAEDDIITTVAGKKFQAPIISDSVASLSGGSLSGAVNITASGTIQASDLTATDDLSVTDDASIGGILGVDGDFDVNTNKFTVAAATGNTTVAGTLGVTGTTTLTGALVANGNVDLGNAISDTITFVGTVDSNITPNTNNTQQVGISTRKFTAMHATTFNGALTGNVTGTVSSLSGHDLDALDDINYTTTPSNGQILVWDNGNSYWEPADQNTSDSVAEGSNNLYYTETRGDTTIKGAVGHGNHTNISVAENGNPGDAGYEIRLTAAATYANSDVQSYLSGGSGVAMSGAGVFSVDTSDGVKLDGAGTTAKVVLDYSIIDDGDLSGGLPSGTGKSVGHLYFLI
jgi:hypothetical protein